MQVFLWLDNREAEMALFRKAFGVDLDINSFTSLVRKWEGGEQSVKLNNKTIRGLCFKVDYLPLSLVLEFFNLVNISINILENTISFSCGEMPSIHCWRRCGEGCSAVVSSAPAVLLRRVMMVMVVKTRHRLHSLQPSRCLA